MKLYDVFGVKPSKVVEDCHAPLPKRYSHPVMVLSVMLVAVLDAIVGAEGAAWVALATVAVAGDVTLPEQLAAFTTTLIGLLTSAATST